MDIIGTQLQGFQDSISSQGTRSLVGPPTLRMQGFMCPISFPSYYDAPSQVLKLAYLVSLLLTFNVALTVQRLTKLYVQAP